MILHVELGVIVALLGVIVYQLHALRATLTPPAHSALDVVLAAVPAPLPTLAGPPVEPAPTPVKPLPVSSCPHGGTYARDAVTGAFLCRKCAREACA